MKSIKTYVTTYDRKLTNLLGEIIAYKMSTNDSTEEQKQMRDKIVSAIDNAFNPNK
jgi:hypothetical protein